MDLIFNKVEGKDIYRATQEVGADFNLHIVREKPARVVIGVSTATDGYYSQAYDKNEPAVFDHDFDAKVYPKMLCIDSYAPVISATLTEA